MKLYVFNETSPKPSKWSNGSHPVLVLAESLEKAKAMGKGSYNAYGDPIEVCMDESAFVADVDEPP